MVRKNITKVDNANIFLNGESQLGKADEVNISANYKFLEKKPLGMMSPQEFYSGLEKIECKIKWNSFYSDVLKKTANPLVPISLQIRSNVEKWTGDELTAEVPLVIYLRAKQTNMPGLGFKQHEAVENESTLKVNYLKIVEEGTVLMEIDTEENKFIVDGVDIYSTYRSNLGI
ncbi:MAG: phage major tail tube protein [bacterium]